MLNISYSYFANNSAAKIAGVAYALNTDVNVTNCTFVNNSALASDGGVFYFDCDDTYINKCSYNITNSTFKNNSAYRDGGVIKFTYFKPNITVNNTFINNTASYGPIMASYPVKIVMNDT